jgi:hypothetical protein
LSSKLRKIPSKVPGLIVTGDEASDHIVALSAGQNSSREFGGSAEKYAKFAYSTHFGFSISREASSLECGAFDSTIAFRANDGLWTTRRRSEDWEINENTIISTWSPFRGVEVRSYVVNLFPWHLRVHYVNAEHDLEIAEGAFSAPFSSDDGDIDKVIIERKSVLFKGSGIIDLNNNRTSKIVRCFPNTNIKYRETILPMIYGKFEPGNFVISCLVLGDSDGRWKISSWNSPPDLRNWLHLWDVASS